MRRQNTFSQQAILKWDWISLLFRAVWERAKIIFSDHKYSCTEFSACACVLQYSKIVDFSLFRTIGDEGNFFSSHFAADDTNFFEFSWDKDKVYQSLSFFLSFFSATSFLCRLFPFVVSPELLTANLLFNKLCLIYFIACTLLHLNLFAIILAAVHVDCNKFRGEFE